MAESTDPLPGKLPRHVNAEGTPLYRIVLLLPAQQVRELRVLAERNQTSASRLLAAWIHRVYVVSVEREP
jgi:hypothetical protein